MYLILRLCSLFSIVALVFSRAGLDERKQLITAPARLRRQADADPAITGRADFVGYELGYDNTWTPEYCWGTKTTYQGLLGCCTASDSCEFILGCSNGSLLETWFDATETRTGRTLTVPCGGGIVPLPGTCNPAYIYEDAADENPLTSYYCAFGFGHTAPSYYKHLTQAAPVWFTTPSDSYTPTTAPASTQESRRTSSLTTPRFTGTSSDSTSQENSSPESTSTDASNSNSNSKASQTTNPPFSSSTSTSPEQSITADKSGSSSSNTKSLAIGIGVGLGVPLILIALLAWLVPRPLERLRTRLAAAIAPNKPELAGDSTQVPNTNTQWMPEMEAPKYGVRPEEVAASPPVHEIHGTPRGELYGS